MTLRTEFIICLLIGSFHVTTSQRKNILFVVLDDLRPEIGVFVDEGDAYYKAIKTPNFDAFAEDSLIFTRAYSQIALCAPSRNSFMTGRRPDTTRSYDLENYWRETGGNFTTIPQYFKEQGYYSVDVGKIFHPGTTSGNNDKEYSWSETPYTASGESIWETKNHSWLAVSSDMNEQYPQKDRFLTDYAKEKLLELAPAAISGEQPFFFGLGFARPHLPFIAPQQFYDLYPENEIGLAQNEHVPDSCPEIAWSSFGELREYHDVAAMDTIDGSFNTSVPDYFARELRRAYYASVSFVDSLFGEIMMELDNLGLSNNTIVVVFSDHGYQLGEHSEWCKHTLFDIASRLPMMLRVPGQTDEGQGRKTDAFVELVDVFPTLVEASGVENVPLCPLYSTDVPVCHEGHSMMGLVRGEENWKTAAFYQYPAYSNKKMGYTVHTKDFHYTKWVEYRGIPLWNSRHNHMLYDLALDPNMNENVVSDEQYADIVDELDQMLQAGWRHALPPP